MYTVATTHELTFEELARAPKGLKRSLIVVHYSRKADAIAGYEHQECFLSRLRLTDLLELRRGDTLLRSYRYVKEDQG